MKASDRKGAVLIIMKQHRDTMEECEHRSVEDDDTKAVRDCHNLVAFQYTVPTLPHRADVKLCFAHSHEIDATASDNEEIILVEQEVRGS